MTATPLRARELRSRRRDALAEIVGARAGSGLIDARDDLDERALAAAVLAGEAMHLPAPDRERHVVERAHAAEAHRHVLEADRLGGGDGGFWRWRRHGGEREFRIVVESFRPRGAGLSRFRGRGAIGQSPRPASLSTVSLLI